MGNSKGEERDRIVQEETTTGHSELKDQLLAQRRAVHELASTLEAVQQYSAQLQAENEQLRGEAAASEQKIQSLQVHSPCTSAVVAYCRDRGPDPSKLCGLFISYQGHTPSHLPPPPLGCRSSSQIDLTHFKYVDMLRIEDQEPWHPLACFVPEMMQGNHLSADNAWSDVSQWQGEENNASGQ